VEASLHVQWVLYGTFCFVPAEKDANAMLHELHDSNAIWQQNQDTLAALHQDAIRPLDVCFIGLTFITVLTFYL
jgi:hypothetical protein